MENGNEQLAKSLIDLIDETLEEIGELKKSKFGASEISIKGPGEGGIAGKPTDGELDAKKAEGDKDEDDEGKDKDKDKDVEKADMEKMAADMEKMDEVAKAEMYKMYMDHKMKKGTNEQADPGGANSAGDVGGMKKGTNEQADPGGANSAGDVGGVKKSEEAGSEPIQKAPEAAADKTGEEFQKSIDTRFSSLEGKISEVADLIKKIGDTPTERKSVASGTQLDTLKKNNDVEPLSKSQVLGAMWKMKEDGKTVLSEDFAQIETGGLADVGEIAQKYDIKQD